MSKSTLKLLPALMIAITAALVTQPMRAGAIDTLVITENSSTSLAATLNGNPLSVEFGFADAWFIHLAGLGPLFSTQIWGEPDAAGKVNFLQVGIFNFNLSDTGLGVSSDVSFPESGLPDGTPDTTTFTLNGNPLSVTFFDKGDVATVPDTGTTFSLFGLSLTGLGFLRRKLC